MPNCTKMSFRLIPYFKFEIILNYILQELGKIPCNKSFYNNKSLGFKTCNKVKSNVVFTEVFSRRG